MGVCVLWSWCGVSLHGLDSHPHHWKAKSTGMTASLLYFGCLICNEELTLVSHWEDEMRYSLEASASGLTYGKCSMSPSDPKNPSCGSAPLWVDSLLGIHTCRDQDSIKVSLSACPFLKFVKFVLFVQLCFPRDHCVKLVSEPKMLST